MLFSLENVTFGYHGDRLLQNVSLTLSEGERVGFVGGNGEGKTTLLKLIIGELSPDEGNVIKKNGLKIGYLEQTAFLQSELSVYNAMKAVLQEDEILIEKLETAQKQLSLRQNDLSLMEEIERLEKRVAARDSYHIDVKIKTVLNGMGFQNRYEQIVNTMSGGEKTRLKLCRLLLEDPDLLILDEPTNHLDLKTIFWLEDYLATLKGALFVVSHDRYFLDRLTSKTVELERGTVRVFKGNYSTYKKLKEEDNLHRTREYEKQQEEIARLKTYVERNIVRATTAKSAQSRVNKLDRMEVLDKPLPPPRPPRFSFSFDTLPAEEVIALSPCDITAGGKVLLKNATFSLKRGQKCALVGENGTGKTTLLNFLLRESRFVKHGKHVKIAYYDQENSRLNPEERVLDAFWEQNLSMSQTQARSILFECGITEEDVDKKVKELSGGLKAKLSLAIVQTRRANVLLLDEPTNHLDLPARESLETALRQFEGTVLFVSHDRRFIQSVANCVADLENQTITVFSGSYDEYLTSLSTQKDTQVKRPAPPKQAQGNYRTKEERAKEARGKARQKEIERSIECLEEEQTRLQQESIEKAADYKALQAITSRLGDIETQLESLYEEYEGLI